MFELYSTTKLLFEISKQLMSMSHSKDRRFKTGYHNKHIHSKIEQFLQTKSDTEKGHDYMSEINMIATEVKR